MRSFALPLVVVAGATSPEPALPLSLVKQRLLERYGDHAIRPGLVHTGRGEPSVQDIVEVQFGVESFDNIDQRSQTWGVSGYFRAWWHDPRLVYNETEAGVDVIYMSLDDTARIWQPTLYLADVESFSGAMTADGLAESFAVYPNGQIWRSEQRKAKIGCKLDLSLMPYDTQNCTFRMGVYTEQAHELSLRWREGGDAFDAWRSSAACATAWSATGLRQRNEIKLWPSGNYSYAHANLLFTRSPGELKQQMGAFRLAWLLVLLSYLGFFINPTATPARVALGIITILATLSNITALYAKLPPGSGDSWLQRFTILCLYFNLSAFIEQIAVNFGMQANNYVLATEQQWRRKKERIKAREAQRASGNELPSPRTPKALPESGEPCFSSQQLLEEEEEEEEQMEATSSSSSRLVTLRHRKVEESSTTTANLAEVRVEIESADGQAAGSTPQPASISGAKDKASFRTRARRVSRRIAAVVDTDGDGELDTRELICALPNLKSYAKVPFLRVCAYLRFLDVISRYIYPIAFVPFLVYWLSLVNFGNDWNARLAGSACK